MASGKVVDGKVVMDGKPFEEGTIVKILAIDDVGDIELTSEQEAELFEAIAEIERGNFVDGDELLRSLKRRA
jgi:predicted transcriptional regulator